MPKKTGAAGYTSGQKKAQKKLAKNTKAGKSINNRRKVMEDVLKGIK